MLLGRSRTTITATADYSHSLTRMRERFPPYLRRLGLRGAQRAGFVCKIIRYSGLRGFWIHPITATGRDTHQRMWRRISELTYPSRREQLPERSCRSSSLRITDLALLLGCRTAPSHVADRLAPTAYPFALSHHNDPRKGPGTGAPAPCPIRLVFVILHLLSMLCYNVLTCFASSDY